jgi:hypothetical protein
MKYQTILMVVYKLRNDNQIIPETNYLATNSQKKAYNNNLKVSFF